MALIRRVTEGKTLIIVEHDMGVVFDLADRISVLVYGEIIATDTPPRIRANQAVQEAYLGSATAEQRRMLEVRDLHAYYGKSHILHGVDFGVGDGEIVSLLGTQRRRPLDHDQGHHGRGRPHRLGQVQGPRDSSA